MRRRKAKVEAAVELGAVGPAAGAGAGAAADAVAVAVAAAAQCRHCPRNQVVVMRAENMTFRRRTPLAQVVSRYLDIP